MKMKNKKFKIFILGITLLGGIDTTLLADNKENKKIASVGFAINEKNGKFERHEFTRHEVGDNDILIDIIYASICHSDVHQSYGHWGPTQYPIVPGHEIVGIVKKVGKNVTKFKVGDYAGVGTMINSTDEAKSYKRENGGEWKLDKTIWTYGAIDPYHNNEITMGGYSTNIVVDEEFALSIPKEANLEKIAALLCAGITVYSPIEFSEVKAGQKVAVAGYGGLGNIAVKFLKHLGTEITVFDINEAKRDIAEREGIKFINPNNKEDMEREKGKYDFVLSTIPKSYNPYEYLDMLKIKGEMAIVGQPAVTDNASFSVMEFPFHQHRYVYGSLIGSLETTQEMINFAVKNNIYPDVEVIPTTSEALDNVYELLNNSKGEFRYVMDMRKLK